MVAETLYRWLGARYPLTALVAMLQLGYAVFGGGIGLLAVYVDMTIGEFALALAGGFALQSLFVVFSVGFARRHLRPVRRWFAAGKGPGGAEEAWAAASSLPLRFVRSPSRMALGFLLTGGWSVYAAWLLDLPGWSIPVLIAGAAVVSLYATSVLFFVFERALRPVLRDIALCMDGDITPHGPRVPLRMRLLIAVPAVSIVTGVAAAGLSDNDAQVADLGLDVGAALAVAFTISLFVSVLLASSVVAPIATLRRAAERVGAGDLTVRVPVITSDETADLTRAFNRMVSGLHERERLRSALGVLVDPAVAERVAREGTDLAGDEVEVSVLFVDVRSFTSLAEREAARQVVRRLNDLYEVVVPIVHRHGGHANKFVGDGLLAVFGAPRRLDSHADSAVAAALEIAGAVREREEGLRVGIGVNTGRVMAGTIGGGGRLEFTVIGDPVNTAARVEAATRETGDDVLITAETLERLRDGAQRFEERPPIPLRGKQETVALFAPRAAPPA